MPYILTGQLHEDGEYFGIDGEIAKLLMRNGLRPNDTLVDVGCGAGNFIRLLVEECHHQGSLIGVNSSAAHYLPAEMDFARAGRANVQFIEGDARDINLNDGIVDYVMLKHLLYHIEHPELALDEALRIAKLGGSVLIATRNVGHQKEIWQAMPLIAEVLKDMTQAHETREVKDEAGNVVGRLDYSNVVPPEAFYKQYDMARAEKELKARGLTIVDRYMQSTVSHNPLENNVLRLPKAEESVDDAWLQFEAALLALATEFAGALNPDGSDAYVKQSDMSRAVNIVLKPVFYNQAAANGYDISIENGVLLATRQRLVAT